MILLQAIGDIVFNVKEIKYSILSKKSVNKDKLLLDV
jgi:hypothetical protein